MQSSNQEKEYWKEHKAPVKPYCVYLSNVMPGNVQISFQELNFYQWQFHCSLNYLVLTFESQDERQPVKDEAVANLTDFISHFLFHAVQFCTHSGHRCMNDRTILSHFPVIIPHFSSFTLHYPNLATMTYFSTPSQFPRHSRSKLLHSHLHTYLSRELFILPRSGTSLIWWSYRVHKPQVWDLFCWNQENCERCGARQNKTWCCNGLWSSVPSFSLFQRTSVELSSWCQSRGPISLPPTDTPGQMASRLFISIFILYESKKTETHFLWSLFHAGCSQI